MSQLLIIASKLYKFIFWAGYLTVFITAMLWLPWEIDKVQVGTVNFHIRLDHLLHLVVYFLICMYFYSGQRKGLILFKHNPLGKFLLVIFILATFSEIIQLWVPARAFNPMDWVSNVSGVILGLGVMKVFNKKPVAKYS